MLCVVETHPIQYHAPVWRAVQQQYGIPVTAIYGSDFSVAGAVDPEFQTKIAWDTDLLTGYQSQFLSRVKDGGARNAGEIQARGLHRAILSAKPTVVLVNGYSPAFHQAASISALRSRKPILFRGEVNDNAGNRSWIKRALRGLLLRAYYSQITSFLYVGKRAKEHYLRHGVTADKMFFSPYAVDSECHLPFLGENRNKAREDIRSHLQIPNDATVLLFAGKLYEAKGPSIFLEALNLLELSALNGIRVIVMGDGELRMQLECYARTKLAGQVRFVGFQNQSAIGQYFCGSDLFVLPSFSETWGLVVNEALLHGLPSVVTDRVGCWPDLIDPGLTGELCAARSVSSLAQAITRGLRLTRNSTIAAHCRQKALEYNISAAARGVAQAYRHVQNTDAPMIL